MGSLFLVRHATTRASESGVNLGRRTDLPLTDGGHELARQTGAAIRAELSALGASAPRIVSSPAARCRQTASAIASALDLDASELETDDRLWEIDYGEWDGLTAEQCRERNPEIRAQWEEDPYDTSTPGGESGADVDARSSAALDPVEEWLAAERARTAVVVTHNHVVRLRLARLLGIPLPEYRRRVVADPGAYSLMTFGADHPTVRRVNVLPSQGRSPSGSGPVPA